MCGRLNLRALCGDCPPAAAGPRCFSNTSTGTRATKRGSMHMVGTNVPVRTYQGGVFARLLGPHRPTLFSSSVNPRNRAELRVAGQPPVPRNRTSARVARAFAIRFPDRIHTPRTGGGQHMPPPPERKETPPSPPSHCPPSSPPAAAVTRVESRPTPAVDCGVDGTHLPSSKRKRSAPGSRACLTRLPGPGLRGLTPTPHTPRLSRPALPPTHPHLHKTTVTG